MYMYFGYAYSFARFYTHSTFLSAGLHPLYPNAYTAPLWGAAVSQYERGVAPAELRVAGKLSSRLHRLEALPHQMLREVQRYRQLVGRPAISKELIPERYGWLLVCLFVCCGALGCCLFDCCGVLFVCLLLIVCVIVASVILEFMINVCIHTLTPSHPHRETLLGQLTGYLRMIRDEYVAKSSGHSHKSKKHTDPTQVAVAEQQAPPTGKNMPEVVNNIVWIRQLESKVWERG